jgi:hypothetical protein
VVRAANAVKRPSKATTMTSGQAVQDMLHTHAWYAQRGQSLASAALAGARSFVRWSHYPQSDVDDAAHGSRFFYHAHEPHEMLAQEHGHFHVFARVTNRAMPHTRVGHAHLVGISIDPQGTPLRLFTTNQWVTGEDWFDAVDMANAVQRFRAETPGRLAPVARWLTGMVQCYASDIVRLLAQRDEQLQLHAQRTHQDVSQARDDRALHILSEQALPNHWNHLKHLEEESLR